MPFTDNFNRADANLEASAVASGGGSWVHDGLIAAALQISGNFLRCNTTNSTGSAYKAPNQGSADHYVQYKTQATTLSTGSFVCCRLADRSNFVGIRTGDGTAIGQIEVYRRVGGTLSSLWVSAGAAYNSGDIIRLECVGTNFTVKLNGAAIPAATNLPIGNATLTSSDTGVCARTTTGLIVDDFETGPVVATVNVTVNVTGQSAAASAGTVGAATTANVVAAVYGATGNAMVGQVSVFAAIVGGGANVNVWDGGAWLDKPMKTWTGAAWEAKPVKTWNGSAWIGGEIEPEPAPQALLSFAPKSETHLGNIAIDVTTADDPALADIVVYLSPQGIALDRATHFSRVLPAAKASAFVANCGDPTRVSVLPNSDFSAPSPPMPGRNYNISGGTLNHVPGQIGAMTSPDGLNWTLRSTPGGDTATIELKWWDVCWTGPPRNLFVAVANVGDFDKQVMTSPDGINWTLRSLPESIAPNGIAYSPTLDKFVIVGFNVGPSGGRGFISSDAITWTPIINANLAALSWRDVCWSPVSNLFLAVAQTNSATAMATSPDGLTWTRRSSATHGNWQSILWTGPPLNLHVAVANDLTRTYRVMTSPDGLTWTGRTTAFNATFQPRSLAYSPVLNRIMAMGNANTSRVATSTDGINWTDVTATIPGSSAVGWSDVMWGKDRFLAIPGSTEKGKGSLLTSTDGVVWTWLYVEQTSWKVLGYSPDLNFWVSLSQDEAALSDHASWDMTFSSGEIWRAGVNALAFSTIADGTVDLRAHTDWNSYELDTIISNIGGAGYRYGRRQIAFDQTKVGFASPPLVNLTVDDIALFEETETCAPQGVWDLHAFPRNHLGVEGPESTALAVTVV